MRSSIFVLAVAGFMMASEAKPKFQIPAVNKQLAQMNATAKAELPSAEHDAAKPKQLAQTSEALASKSKDGESC